MSRPPHIPPNVVILAFEGPDRYSMIGGLGVRATELALALGENGFKTTLIFVGDPEKAPVEGFAPNVELRRWCQWISKYHPGGVYDGEHGKIDDYAQSAPAFIVSEIVKPAHRRGERVLVLAEDWQVVPAVLRLDRALAEAGLRGAASVAWNANNTYGFETIDWAALARAAHITCVSKYMKFELGLLGVEGVVIPNGIPPALSKTSSERDVLVLQRAMRGRRTLLKVGRFDPDKRWMQAVDALAQLRAADVKVQLLVRGGKEPYGRTIFERARTRGLSISEVTLAESTADQLAHAIAQQTADIVNLRSFFQTKHSTRCTARSTACWRTAVRSRSA